MSGEETAHLVEAAGGAAIFIQTDVTEPDSMEAAIEKTVKEFGRLDVLHNNAGGSSARDDSAVDVALDEFWRTIKLDLFGTFLGCRFGIPKLIAAGGGSVINMASSVAIMGQPRRDSYTAAKGAITALTRSLAMTYGKDKVRVNAIVPAATRTERVQKLIDSYDEVQAILNGQVFGIIEPVDIALAAVYLASDEVANVHGLAVDGGRWCHDRVREAWGSPALMLCRSPPRFGWTEGALVTGAGRGIGKSLALELGSSGVRVNTVCPTVIETDMVRDLLQDTDYRDMVFSKSKLGRLGKRKI